MSKRDGGGIAAGAGGGWSWHAVGAEGGGGRRRPQGRVWAVCAPARGGGRPPDALRGTGRWWPSLESTRMGAGTSSRAAVRAGGGDWGRRRGGWPGGRSVLRGSRGRRVGIGVGMGAGEWLRAVWIGLLQRFPGTAPTRGVLWRNSLQWFYSKLSIYRGVEIHPILIPFEPRNMMIMCIMIVQILYDFFKFKNNK